MFWNVFADQTNYFNFVFLLFFWYSFTPYGRWAFRGPDTARGANSKLDNVRFGIALGKSTPSRYIFGYTWLVLYGLLASAQYIYIREAVGSADFSDALNIWTLNLFLNKLWAPVFFQDRRFYISLGLLVGTLGTAIWIAYYVANDIGSATWAFAFVILYIAWLVLALVFQIMFLFAYQNLSKDEVDELVKGGRRADAMQYSEPPTQSLGNRSSLSFVSDTESEFL